MINRLTSAYLVCKIIAKSPGKVDKSALLRGGDRDAVLRYVRDMRTYLDAHDAERAARESFESLRSFMSEDWLEAQSEAMASSPIEASRRDQLDGLLAKLPQLGTSASFCSQLAGCDPLTPKVSRAWVRSGDCLNSCRTINSPAESSRSSVLPQSRRGNVGSRKARRSYDACRPLVPRTPGPCVTSLLPSPH